MNHVNESKSLLRSISFSTWTPRGDFAGRSVGSMASRRARHQVTLRTDPVRARHGPTGMARVQAVDRVHLLEHARLGGLCTDPTTQPSSPRVDSSSRRDQPLRRRARCCAPSRSAAVEHLGVVTRPTYAAHAGGGRRAAPSWWNDRHRRTSRSASPRGGTLA